MSGWEGTRDSWVWRFCCSAAARYKGSQVAMEELYQQHKVEREQWELRLEETNTVLKENGRCVQTLCLMQHFLPLPSFLCKIPLCV